MSKRQLHPAGREALARVDAYADAMAIYVIDAPTVLHLINNELRIDPSHQLVAPNSIRSEALQLLLTL